MVNKGFYIGGKTRYRSLERTYRNESCYFVYPNFVLFYCLMSPAHAELVMGWVHPWVGLGWDGLGQSFFNFWWVGLGGDLTVM